MQGLWIELLLAATYLWFVGLHPLWALLWALIAPIPGAYHVRMFALLLKGAIWDPPLRRIRDETVLHFRAMPSCCDWNIHMGNSHYNMLTDFARYYHLARMVRRVDVAGANGGVYMRFKREIKPFEAFELQTRICGYDDKWLFVEHRFFVDGRCRACGICKLVVRKRGVSDEWMPPAEVLRSHVDDVDSLPPFVGGKLLLETEPHFGRDN